jgi:hypothetical protein
MKTSILCMLGFLAWSSQAIAWGKLPPDTQPGAVRLLLMCTVDDAGLSKLCRFYNPIADEKARRLAGAELGWLDNDPFPISGAAPGTEVKVLVRLRVSAVKGTADFDVSAPPGAFPAASGPEIAAPVWIVSPHEDWTGDFVPDRPARMNQKGEATVRCVATEIGTLANCWLMQETPADFGFGDAVLMLLQLVRMKPDDAGGAPVAGRPFVQTLRYEGLTRSAPYPAFKPAWAR